MNASAVVVTGKKKVIWMSERGESPSLYSFSLILRYMGIPFAYG